MSISLLMDRTGSRKIEEMETSAEHALEFQARERRIRQLGQRFLTEGLDLEGLIRIALDGLIEYLSFERGFLVVAKQAPSLEVEEEEGESLFDILGARAARRQDAPDGELVFEEVPNPEFAINHSAVKRAFRSVKALAIHDSLSQPHSEGQEAHRSVLCQPFSLAPGVRAVVYLDRGLGKEPVKEQDLSTLAEFAEQCLPWLGRAYLYQEVLALREQLEAEEGRSDLSSPPPAASHQPPAVQEDEPGITITPDEIPIYHGMVGKSEKLRRIFQVIDKMKDSDLNVCIFGESGTGKELVAKAIHETSRRAGQQFVSENCGTIAETLLESELFGHTKGAFTGADEDRQGLFEIASGGTLLLDEVGDMSEGMQRKLLRVLQEGEIRPIGSKQTMKVDTRVVCSSNRNLPALVKSGAFRVDLFYRINVISIEVPPLRERLEDLPLLAVYFLKEIEQEDGVARRISESAMTALEEYSWPGNVRELRNVIRRASVTCFRRTIARKDVAPFLTSGQAAGFLGQDLERSETQIVLRVPRRETFNEIIGECERIVLLNALKECRWNKSKVVKNLKIPRQSLYNMIAKHNLRRKWET